MRECHGLVDSLIYVLKCAVRPEEDNDSITNNMDNKVRGKMRECHGLVDSLNICLEMCSETGGG